MNKLENVEELAKKNPDSFKILPREWRETLKIGDYAKLIFRFAAPVEGGPDGERMWVKVSNPTVNGEVYIGTLQNIPTLAPDLRYGQLVYFKPENICQIMRDGEAVVGDTDDGNVEFTHKTCNHPNRK